MSNQKIKILHIIPGFGGGISSYVKNLISGSNNDHLKMDIMGFGIPSQGYIDLIEEYGSRIYILPSIYKTPFQVIKTYKTILKKNQYDVVQCHIFGYKGLFFKMIAKFNKINNIAMHAHTAGDEDKNIFYPITLKISQFFSRAFCNIYFKCSEVAAEHIYGKKFAEHNQIYFIPNGVDKKYYDISFTVKDKEKLLKEFGLSESDILIGNIARFNKVKNHFFMIDTLEKLVNLNKNYKLILVGSGELESKIKAYVNSKDLNENVFFLGTRQDVNKIYQILDICLLPSLFEGLPTVAIESQVSNVPIILSNNITKEVDLGIGLIYFLPINNGVDCWCSKIKELTKVKKKVYKNNIQILIEKGFTSVGMGKKYEKIIKMELLRRKKDEKKL